MVRREGEQGGWSPGHERDTETGNDYMHFRFFSASMGRFQKPDSNFDSPIANPQGWNLYFYVKGNPVNFNDPTGHQTALPSRNSNGPDWAPVGRRFDDSPAFQDAIWGASTLSNLGQTMTPKATGQAAPQAQGTWLPTKDYSFKLDPTVPKPGDGQQTTPAMTSQAPDPCQLWPPDGGFKIGDPMPTEKSNVIGVQYDVYKVPSDPMSNAPTGVGTVPPAGAMTVELV